jgi:ABC-type amino acid transport system permease subunit
MESFKQKFIQDFIEQNRWHYITDGLKTTIQVTILSLIIGVIIGMVVAIIRCAHDQQEKKDLKGFKGFLLKLGNLICRIYITVIRGTPTLVQLLIMYFIILVSFRSKVAVAVLTFGINSGAYVAEIFRGGIMAVDKGQMEAGRSLGLGYVSTMKDIILPQAFKSVLPSLVNELITLLKETSICGYIGLNELTRGGDIIRGTTFDALLPLFGVAIIYLIMVLFISYLMGILERRLRASDHR